MTFKIVLLFVFAFLACFLLLLGGVHGENGELFNNTFDPFSSFSFFLFNLDSNDPSPGPTLEFLDPTSSGKALIKEFSSKTTLDHDFHKLSSTSPPRATEYLYS